MIKEMNCSHNKLSVMPGPGRSIPKVCCQLCGWSTTVYRLIDSLKVYAEPSFQGDGGKRARNTIEWATIRRQPNLGVDADDSQSASAANI